MKTKIISIIILLSLFSCIGCGKRNEDFKLDEPYSEATGIYYEGDVNSAAIALEVFIDRVENNINLAERSKDAEYKKLLDMSWLRLATVYQAQGKTDKFDQAINRAIGYFDQDPSVVLDAAYKQNKKECLLNMLHQLESREMPKWKRALKQKQNQANGVR